MDENMLHAMVGTRPACVPPHEHNPRRVMPRRVPGMLFCPECVARSKGNA